LSAKTPQAHNTPADPEAVAPEAFDEVTAHPSGLQLVLPPHSYVTISVSLS
jgi:alpha-N-arabinofuranosidase